jgi:hypothetical protein
MRSDEIVFFAFCQNADGKTELSIVSPHRNIEATLVHQSWELKRSNGIARSYTASNTPLETVTYAEPRVEMKLSPEELIVSSGQNATQLTIDIEKDEMPCLLATGCDIETHKVRVKGNLALETWAETADFQAEQSYWTTRYQKQIDSGDEFLRPRLEDYANERRLAESILIEAGSRLPVSFELKGTLCLGCLVLDAIDKPSFSGQLFASVKLESLPEQLERRVRTDGETEICKVVATDLLLLDD